MTDDVEEKGKGVCLVAFSNDNMLTLIPSKHRMVSGSIFEEEKLVKLVKGKIVKFEILAVDESEEHSVKTSQLGGGTGTGETNDDVYGTIIFCTPIFLSREPMLEMLNGHVATEPVEKPSYAYSHLR